MENSASLSHLPFTAPAIFPLEAALKVHLLLLSLLEGTPDHAVQHLAVDHGREGVLPARRRGTGLATRRLLGGHQLHQLRLLVRVPRGELGEGGGACVVRGDVGVSPDGFALALRLSACKHVSDVLKSQTTMPKVPP